MPTTSPKSASKHSIPTHTHTATSRHRAITPADRRGGPSRHRTQTDSPDQADARGGSSRSHAPQKERPAIVAGPSVDKLVLALLDDALSDDAAEAVIRRLRKLCRTNPSKNRAAGFTRGTTKGDIFKRVVMQRLPSGATVKFALEPSRASVKQRLQLTFNPNLMDDDDAQAFGRTLKKLLAPDWERLRRAFLCTRIDINLDVQGVDINRLIIVFEGARSHGLFFVQIDRQGKVQTVYCGSSQSATHGVAYDQGASEAYKAMVGEKTLTRPRIADDAELSISPTSERVRFEVRNVLKKPLRLSKLRSLPTALGKFRVYEVSEAAERKVDARDLALIDTVRLRGLAGARVHLTAGKSGRQAVDALDHLLERFVAAWWNPDDLAQEIASALKEAPVWRVFLAPRP